MPIKHGGHAWRLEDGGWAFQYPTMAARVAHDGMTNLAWSKPEYAVEVDPEGVSYHAGDTVVRRDVGGGITFQRPGGTAHQEGETIIYHWCKPNLIVYQTPNSLVYYDDQGMTYRGNDGIAHYARNGEVLYQGVGGITLQRPGGEITHWTNSGVIYRHRDGSLTYTPVGETESKAMDPKALGSDPFPGPPLTIEDVDALARQAWEQAEAAKAAAAAKARESAAMFGPAPAAAPWAPPVAPSPW